MNAIKKKSKKDDMSGSADMSFWQGTQMTKACKKNIERERKKVNQTDQEKIYFLKFFIF